MKRKNTKPKQDPLDALVPKSMRDGFDPGVEANEKLKPTSIPIEMPGGSPAVDYAGLANDSNEARYEELAAVLIDPFQRLEHITASERSYRFGKRRVNRGRVRRACKVGIGALSPEEVEVVLREDRDALDALIKASGRWFGAGRLPTAEELDRAPACPPLPADDDVAE
jgi:hypothetical protein